MRVVIGVLLLLSILVPFGLFFFGEKKKKSFKRVMAFNAVAFFGILAFSTVFLFSQGVNAEEAVEATAKITGSAAGMAFIAAALVTGLSSLGAGIAVASAASAAIGAISEDEAIFSKALIFVALAEGIALYGLLVSFTILGRV
ncbi:MAG: ATPase [Clostridiales bacterium]|jgi:V/A-type H+-transporting ATPase subunit K|nr:ATPase [Clostridiales bacterium]